MSRHLAQTPLAGGVLSSETSDLVLAEWDDPGGGHEPPLLIAPRHVHHADDEAFYVLEGTLAFELDGEAVTVGAGGAVVIPRGTMHTWWNPNAEPARYLIVMTRRVHELISRLHAPGEERPLAELFTAYQSEIVGP